MLSSKRLSTTDRPIPPLYSDIDKVKLGVFLPGADEEEPLVIVKGNATTGDYYGFYPGHPRKASI